MAVRLERILAQEGKVDMRLKRFVASANAASGRGQDSISHYVLGKL